MPVTGSARAARLNEISTRGVAVCAVTRVAATAAVAARPNATARRIPRFSVFICGYASKMKAGCLLAMATIGFLSQPGPAPVPTYGYQVVRSFPHDPGAFIQGLSVREGVFYEGTGLNGRSGIRKVKIETGEVLQSKPIGSEYFGEGITDWKDSLIEITWQSGIGFVYDLKTFEQKKTWSYKGEGWGITHDDTRLIMSDGT